jgi:polyhydroxyalkanoate synthesis regulator phasin
VFVLKEILMVDALRKLLLAGLGTLDLTEEKAKTIFNDLVARGEMNEKEARELVSGWAKRAAEQRDRLQQDVERTVARTMTAMGLANKAEVETLSARVAELEQQLAAARAAAAPVDPPKTES